MKKYILPGLIISFLVTVAPLSVSAQTIAVVVDMIYDLVTLASWILIALAVLFFVLAGINFVLGGGDPSKIDTGKKMVLWGVIGLTVGLLAWAIANWVGYWVG